MALNRPISFSRIETPEVRTGKLNDFYANIIGITNKLDKRISEISTDGNLSQGFVHTSAMPDKPAINGDHDRRYWKKSALASTDDTLEGSTLVGYKDSTTLKSILDNTLNPCRLSGLVISDDGGLGISWTAGQVYTPDGDILDVSASSGTCTDDSINYLIWSSGSTLTLGTTQATTNELSVGVIGCQDSDIWEIVQEPLCQTLLRDIHVGLADHFLVTVTTGLIVSEDTDATNDLDVSLSNGTYYHHIHSSTDVSNILSRNTALRRWFHSGGNWTNDTNAEIDNTQYDNGTNLVAMGASKWFKSLFLVSENEIHWIYPQAEFATEAAAIDGALPSIPPGLELLPKSTAVVMQQGDTTFPAAGGDRWVDVRPLVTGTGVGAAVTDHGSLSGLADDDHTQYFLADGTRAMTGNIELDGNWLSGDGGNEGVFVASDGDVGIGESSPSDMLEVAGFIRTTASEPRVRWEDTDTTDQNWQFQVASGSMLFRTNNDAFSAASTKMTLSNAGSLSFPTGVGINEFSSDGTLAGNSDTAVPTEKAVKTYVDGAVSLDHGALTGLGDDDHTQYHNDTRGDARYYTQTLLDAGQLDNRYFTEAEHIATSAGAGDAGKPIKLDAAGHIDATMINDGDVDHGSIGGLSDDDHSQYHNDTRGDARYYTKTLLDAGQLDNRYFTESEHIDTSAGAGDAGKPIKLDAAGHIDATMINDGDIDHGSIGGLSDDDHSQYHNDTRGDARYYTQAQHISTSAGAGDSGKPIVLDAGGHIDATMINDADIDHGTIGGLADDDHTQYHNDTRGDVRYFTQTQLTNESQDISVNTLTIGDNTQASETDLYLNGNCNIATEQSMHLFIDSDDNSTSSAFYFRKDAAFGGGTLLMTLSEDGRLLLTLGTGVNEFSTDGTLAGNSDDAVPTEQAVKTYVDATIVADHGALTGLADDDHSQYHNNTRGDARYYTQSQLNAGQLNNIYFTESEHIDVSAGAADSGKPIKLDAAGHVDGTMLNDADIDHGSVSNLLNDDHTQYFLEDGTRAMSGNIQLSGNWLSNDGGNEGVFVDTAGQVGINDGAPETWLHVNSGTDNDVALFESTDTSAFIYFKDNTTASSTLVGLGATGNDLNLFAESSSEINFYMGASTIQSFVDDEGITTQNSGGTPSYLSVDQYSTTVPPVLRLRRTDNDTLGSFSATSGADILGEIHWLGSSGAAFDTTAVHKISADEVEMTITTTCGNVVLNTAGTKRIEDSSGRAGVFSDETTTGTTTATGTVRLHINGSDYDVLVA